MSLLHRGLALSRGQIALLHQTLAIYTFVFVVWGLYRLLFPINTWIEELFLKPLVFAGPIFWLMRGNPKLTLESLGMHTRRLLPAVYFGFLFGLWLAVAGHLVAFFKTQAAIKLVLSPVEFGDIMLLGLVTAFWEQLLFSGFMLPRFEKIFRSELLTVGSVALLFTLIHLPIQLVKAPGIDQIIVRMLLLFTLGFGNGVLYARFRNLAAPIFAHLAWGSVIYLFG